MQDYLDGAAYLGRGWRMLRRRPGLLLLGMVPALIVWLVLASAFLVLVLNLGDVAAWMTPFAGGWVEVVRRVLRFLVGLALVVGAVLLWSATFTGLTLAVGDPFYERIWRACEDMLGPVKLGDGPGFWHSVVDGVKLTLVGLLTSVAVLLSGLIPVLGPVLGIVLGLLLSGRLLARELLGRPLEARGMDRAAQRVLLEPHRRRVLGLGVATQACFLVPLGGVLVMPIAVAAATVLARDVLPDERGPAYAGEVTRF